MSTFPHRIRLCVIDDDLQDRKADHLGVPAGQPQTPIGEKLTKLTEDAFGSSVSSGGQTSRLSHKLAAPLTLGCGIDPE